MSCLLFNLAIEPLAHALRQSTLRGFEIPGRPDRLITTLFADDTTVYLSKDDNYDTLAGILTMWCGASGARFNITKTEHVPLGPPEMRHELIRSGTIPQAQLRLPEGSKIAQEGEAIRILGAWIGNDIDATTSWRPLVAKIRENLSRWARRRPTLYGRKLIIGLELGSRTQFLTAAQGMPKTIESELVTLAMNFFWEGMGRPVVARAPLARGGRA
ncbi:hypothetical protein PYCCODRAFT_1443909 [Trametes coccinea BRFM310]|uniref:Uncharacterized protein n=1 Tax=Trametes coccinea (strain BRFM310) TaxID=1353009 RepID=A0A1Y2IU62_TRAC3|nr:hypothetical protein PYCCODRAFT_1443909 [Trametes coccinea BRFM310]